MFKKEFPSGKYYIGDPCYVVSDDNWHNLLEETDYFRNEEQSYRGFRILAGDTAYGDGTYSDNYGREYPVDAGLIGIMPIDVIDNDKYDLTKNYCPGNFIDFECNFIVTIDNGVFKFGNIIIDTLGETEEDE